MCREWSISYTEVISEHTLVISVNVREVHNTGIQEAIDALVQEVAWILYKH